MVVSFYERREDAVHVVSGVLQSTAGKSLRAPALIHTQPNHCPLHAAHCHEALPIHLLKKTARKGGLLFPPPPDPKPARDFQKIEKNTITNVSDKRIFRQNIPTARTCNLPTVRR